MGGGRKWKWLEPEATVLTMTPYQKEKTLGSPILNPPLKLLQGQIHDQATAYFVKAFGGIGSASQNKTNKNNSFRLDNKL